jgi:glycosyltransferase
VLKISIITAVYNGAETLGDTISSVTDQDYVNLEHIIIDGGSTDGTLALLQNLREDHAHWISEPDEGIYPALNKGIGLATGDIVGFLHADDIYSGASVVGKIASVFSDPDVLACYGDLEYVRRAHTASVVRYWKSGPYCSARLCKGWMPPHPTFYARRELYAAAGGFDCTFRIAADYDCMLRLLKRIDDAGGRVAYLPEVVVKMRLGGASNRSLSNILLKSSEDWRAIRKNRVGGPLTLLLKNVGKLGQFWRR